MPDIRHESKIGEVIIFSACYDRQGSRPRDDALLLSVGRAAMCLRPHRTWLLERKLSRAGNKRKGGFYGKSYFGHEHVTGWIYRWAQPVVLSHTVPEKPARGATAFTFVADGLQSALTQAKAAAGDKDVVVGGGATTAQQFISAELIDELQIHLVLVLLGKGLRLFDHLGTKPVKLEKTNGVDAPDVTHLTFRVVKEGDQ
jgi:RibD C-terminal domain